MLNQKILRIIGIAFLVIGAIFLIISFAGITGYSVFIGRTHSSGAYVAIWFFLVGSVLITVSESRLETIVYNTSEGKKKGNPDRDYRMEDNEMELGGGPISLGEFRKTINQYSRERGGAELIGIISAVYGPGLREVALSKDAEKAKVAKAFLEVLGEKVEEKRQENYQLSSDEKNRIKAVFRGFNGTLSSRQREIIREYGFEYDNSTGGHPMLVHESGNKIPLPSTPSRQKTGLYVATSIIHLIEETKNKE